MPFRTDPSLSRLALGCSALVLASALAACSGKKGDSAATQAAARVNDTEVTVHQINFRLQQDRGLKPEQVEAASRRMLERLVDQELVLQKAEQLKLDRDPRIVQALDAARHDVLARAYVEQVVQGVPAPTDEAVRKYFDDNPDLFSRRRVYAIVELVAKPSAEQAAALKAKVESGSTGVQIAAWLKSQSIEFQEQALTRTAEQVPLVLLKTLAKLPEGRALYGVEGGLSHVSVLTSSHEEPVGFEVAKPVIAQYLNNEARRKAVESNVAALRSAAKIEYLGKYADQAASAPARVTTLDADLKVQLPGASGVSVSLPKAAPEGVKVSLPSASAASGVQVNLPNATGTQVDAETTKKGLGVK